MAICANKRQISGLTVAALQRQDQTSKTCWLSVTKVLKLHRKNYAREQLLTVNNKGVEATQKELCTGAVQTHMWDPKKAKQHWLEMSCPNSTWHCFICLYRIFVKLIVCICHFVMQHLRMVYISDHMV